MKIAQAGGVTRALILAAALAVFAGDTNASPAHCSDHGGASHACDLCMHGHWPTGESYPCPAAEARAQQRWFDASWKCWGKDSNVPGIVQKCLGAIRPKWRERGTE